jgi:hypothetical protein
MRTPLQRCRIEGSTSANCRIGYAASEISGTATISSRWPEDDREQARGEHYQPAGVDLVAGPVSEKYGSGP